MKYYLNLLFFILCPFFLLAQELPDKQEEYYDFWVGHWEVSWDEGNGKTGKGTNTIKPTLDGKVLQENFRILEGQSKGFKGTSLSVYQPALKQWKQAWSDNQGGYYDFVGAIDGNKRIFKTAIVEKGDKQLISRMVFYDIKKNSLTWDWESSEDGGANWKLNWRIFYKRLDKKDWTVSGLNAKAPSETLQFGQFVGVWDCHVQNLQQDGTWLEKQSKWIWKYALDGFAIQDFWYGTQGMGTNIRIYDPAQKKWINTWVENSNNTMSGLWDATMKDDGSIEMHDGTGQWVIVFYNITKDAFDWKWDYLQPDGSMKTVSKIKAVRINKD